MTQFSINYCKHTVCFFQGCFVRALQKISTELDALIAIGLGVGFLQVSEAI